MSESLIASVDPNAWLDAKHPHYLKMDCLERWQRWRAVVDGFETQDIKKTFLPRTEIELTADYEFRTKVTEFISVTESAVERITGAVFANPARIESDNEFVTEFIKDCDGAGTGLVDFFETVSPEAQCMGIAFVGIDREKAHTEEPITTMAQEVASGSLQCFATLYTAEEVRNWQFDSTGELLWVIIGRTISRQSGPRSAVQYFEERRVIDRETVEIWRKNIDDRGRPIDDKSLWRLEESVSHNLGVVPIVPVYGDYFDPMEGKSIHVGTMKADIARLNEESWATIDRYRHANQLLALTSDRELKELHVGHVFRLFEGEDLKYVSPTSVAFDAQEKAIARLKQDAITHSGSNPAATSDAPGSTTGESGIAQRVRFTHTEQRTIKKHARSIVMGIEKILRIVEQWLTGKIVEGGTKVSFFTSFDSIDPNDRINSYMKLQYAIGSESWHRHQLKKLAIETSPDATDAERDAMQKEIDAQSIQTQPDPQTQGFGN